MSVNRINFTFLWITLAFVLFPALVLAVPLSTAKQHTFELDPLEEIVPEEPLSLQIIEEVTGVSAVKEEAPINNLNISMDQTDVEEKERENDETVVLSVQEKPLIKLLSQEPSEVTYELIDSRDALEDETSLPIDKIKPLVLSTTLAPAFEESITTKSKIILEKELLQLQSLKKSTSHKKQVLLKILNNIVNQVLLEECTLSVEEVLPTTLAEDSTHRVEELEEISPSEKKVLLRRVIKALNLYLETAKVENVPSSHSSSLEEPKSSSVKQVSTSAVPQISPFFVTEKPKPDYMFKQYFAPNYGSPNIDMFEKYFLKQSMSVPRIG